MEVPGDGIVFRVRKGDNVPVLVRLFAENVEGFAGLP